MSNVKMVTLRMQKNFPCSSKKEGIEGTVTFENMVNRAIERIETEFLREVVDIKYTFDSSGEDFYIYIAMIIYK